MSKRKLSNVLSRASEVGSSTNHLGSRQRRDTGQGSSQDKLPKIEKYGLTIGPLNIIKEWPIKAKPELK